MSVNINEIKTSDRYEPQLTQSQEEQKIQKLTNQIFIIMRHADKGKGSDPSITDKGKLRTKIAAEVIQGIAKERGKTEIQLIVSSIKRSQETGAVVAEALKIVTAPHIEARIRECNPSFLSKEEKKKHPQYQYYSHLKDEKEKFRCMPVPNVESGEMLFQRMQEGIHARLDTIQDPAILPVFVAHQTAMKSLFEGLTYTNQLQGETSSTFLKSSHYCEIFVIERRGASFVALERKPISST